MNELFNNVNYFVGIVEDNMDPTNAGRIRVRVFGIHPPYETGEVLTPDLPWAFLVNGTGGKMFGIPDEGDWVFGLFLDGRDGQHPIVFGVINGVKATLPQIGGSYDNFDPNNIVGVGSSANAEYAYNYFISKGLSPEQAAGIIGNLQAESGKNLNPSAYNPAGGGDGAKGIAQWRGDRQTRFQNRYGKDLLNATLNEQLDYIMYEFNTTEAESYNAIKKANSPAESARAFDSLFERSGGGSLNTRIGNANAMFS